MAKAAALSRLANAAAANRLASPDLVASAPEGHPAADRHATPTPETRPRLKPAYASDLGPPLRWTEVRVL